MRGIYILLSGGNILVSDDNFVTSVNEGMDEVYEWAEDQRKRPTYFEQEVDAIMRQGLDPKHRREFIDRDALDGVKPYSLFQPLCSSPLCLQHSIDSP